MTRTGLVVRGWAGGLAGLLVAVALFGLPGGAQPAGAGRGPGFRGALLPPGIPVPDVVLHDERGHAVRLGAGGGRPYVVAFLSAACRDACPLTAQTILLALDDLERQVRAYAIAVDPPRDTPAAARRFLVRRHLLGRMRFLLGTRAELEPAWRGFAVQPTTAAIEHQDRIVLVDGAGIQRVGYFGATATPESIAHDLELLQG